MSKASIGDHFLAEMTEGQEVDAAFKDHANGKVSECLPDGLENLRSAYQEFWAETHHSTQTTTPDGPELENLTVKVEPEAEQPSESSKVHRHRAAQSKTAVLKRRRITKAKVRSSGRPAKQRFGLPEGFVPRMQRFGRAVLLELNVYRLPNGQEFIPCVPTGTLGSRHLYALVTNEQHMSGGQGSVYVRSDGKIFDYSGASANTLDDMFDTGYTIYDLERTGRYAPNPKATRRTAGVAGRSKRQRKKKTQETKYRHTATAR
ncbi:MAG: hypothetical protein M3R52_12690 [Acidobacteriota bacterium]|nr:hypothetical protein [Acidobacteriota bacterium]